MNTDRSCAVFGQHPLLFPWGFDEEAEGCRRMKLELAQSILELRQQGVTEFQVACDPGVGLYAGEIVHALAEQERNIRLVCVMPHEGQATKWTPQLRERYFDMLACCDEVRCLAPRAQPGGQLLAYQKIVRDTNMTLAVYAPELANGSPEDKAAAYAMALNRPMLMIQPVSLVRSWNNRH